MTTSCYFLRNLKSISVGNLNSYRKFVLQVSCEYQINVLKIIILFISTKANRLKVVSHSDILLKQLLWAICNISRFIEMNCEKITLLIQDFNWLLILSPMHSILLLKELFQQEIDLQKIYNFFSVNGYTNF